MTGFVGCANTDDSKDDSSANNTISWESVFIPDDLSSKTLAGIYTGSYSDSSEAQGFKESGTYAFCLYEDGTFAETYKGTYTNTSTGTTTKVEKGVWKGTYTKVEGDYTNGKFIIKITLQWDPENNDWGYLNRPGTLNLLISDGAFKFEKISYGKKEIKTSDSGSGGSTNLSYYFPSELKNEEIEAWYTGADSSGGVYALFFWQDSRNYQWWVQTYRKDNTMKRTIKGEYNRSTEFVNGMICMEKKYQWNSSSGAWSKISPTPATEWPEVRGGTFTYSGVTYNKQSGTPTVTSESSSGGSGSGGGNTTGDKLVDTVTVPNTVFYPTDYASYTISALFTKENGTTTYALFFFSDGTWLETSYDADSGYKVYCLKGTWTKTTGDFTSGTFSIARDSKSYWSYANWTADSRSGTGTISNDALTVTSSVTEMSSYTLVAAKKDTSGSGSGSGGSSSGGSSSSGSGSGGSSGGTSTSVLSGNTYSFTLSSGATDTITFTGSSFVYTYRGTTPITGTYTVSGTTATLNGLHTGYDDYTTITTTNNWNTLWMNGAEFTKVGSSGNPSGSGGTASGVTLPSEFQSKTVSAVFYYTEYSSYLNGNETTYLYFFSDNTFITMWSFGNESEPASKGVYSMTGSWTSGSLVVTNQYNYDGDWIAWDPSEDGSPYATGSLSSSALTVTYEGKSETFPRLQ